jgi:hypothetical protein
MDLVHFAGAFQRMGLKDRNPACERKALDRTRLRLQAATGRAVGLRDCRDDRVAFGDEARQRPLCKFGRAGED